MAPETDNETPMSTGSQTGHEPAHSTKPPGTTSHGSSGEGAGSAMARLIIQEQARIVPGAPADAPNGSP